VAGKTKSGCRGGCLAAMVRLRRTCSDHCIAAICQRLGHEKFQLPRLIAAERQPTQVVPLDPEMWPGQSAGKSFHFRQRGWKEP
jgi:hypothetical protein